MGRIALTADQRTRTRFAAVATASPGASASGGGPPIGTLEEEINALTPTTYIRMSEAVAPTEQGTARTWTASGTITYQNVAGPDGNDYPNFGANAGFFTADAADLGLDAATGRTFCIASYGAATDVVGDSLFGKLTPNPRDYAAFTTGADGLISFISYQDSSGSAHGQYRAATPFENVGWSFFVFRFNTDGTTDIWVNSTTADAVTEVLAPTGTVEEDGTAALYVGRLQPFSGYDWATGALAHFAMFPTALDDADCERIVQAAINEGWTP